MSICMCRALQAFRDIGSSLVTVFNWLMGGVDLTIFAGTHNPQIGLAMLLVYWFTMSMVLLNCLIAILADACSRVRRPNPCHPLF